MTGGNRVRDRGNLVFTALDWPVFVVLAAINLTAVWIAGQRVLSHADFAHHPASVLILVPFAVGLASYEARWFTLPLMRRPTLRAARPGWTVGVATTFVPGGEPLAMLERTVRSLVAMDYPHETWVLDEGDDADVRDLCERLGARHFSRRGRPEYQQPSGPYEARSKHGNYNAWLTDVGYDSYDIIAAFDPDHVPRRNFLTRLIGCFDDEQVGYVQAPQIYYNQPASFVARGAAEETYAYYSSIQMTSYALGYPIVTGCHNVHRVTALRDVGGFAAHDADDLLITVHYRARGWEGVYVGEELAAGITPVDWRGYLVQQRRWARSVLDVKLRIFPKVARDLPPAERVVGTLHGLYYLHGLGTALSVGLLALMLGSGGPPPVVNPVSARALFLVSGVLFACDLYRQRFFLKRRTEWGIHLRAAVLKFAKWPYVLLALVDAIRGRRGSYALTSKVRLHGRLMLARSHGTVIAIIGAAWLVGLMRGGVHSHLLQVAAGAVIAMSAGVIASELRAFPDPYDDDLAAAALPYSEGSELSEMPVRRSDRDDADFERGELRHGRDSLDLHGRPRRVHEQQPGRAGQAAHEG